jgi:hypothetical protein
MAVAGNSCGGVTPTDAKMAIGVTATYFNSFDLVMLEVTSFPCIVCDVIYSFGCCMADYAFSDAAAAMHDAAGKGPNRPIVPPRANRACGIRGLINVPRLLLRRRECNQSTTSINVNAAARNLLSV